ncbi:hypothetical protein ElyMa_001553600 [Elysia marginata]|uniref:Uncharacterized protein n=1 Tax=Elysia marginata TaxID=1093978 RepID=A0AAV4JAG4_9GAST|nr:hypothetical protein ElyMa_001553600 [Elysia marginata]
MFNNLFRTRIVDKRQVIPYCSGIYEIEGLVKIQIAVRAVSDGEEGGEEQKIVGGSLSVSANQSLAWKSSNSHLLQTVASLELHQNLRTRRRMHRSNGQTPDPSTSVQGH